MELALTFMVPLTYTTVVSVKEANSGLIRVELYTIARTQ
jgi:hypothetical protein